MTQLSVPIALKRSRITSPTWPLTINSSLFTFISWSIIWLPKVQILLSSSLAQPLLVSRPSLTIILINSTFAYQLWKPSDLLISNRLLNFMMQTILKLDTLRELISCLTVNRVELSKLHKSGSILSNRQVTLFQLQKLNLLFPKNILRNYFLRNSLLNTT